VVDLHAEVALHLSRGAEHLKLLGRAIYEPGDDLQVSERTTTARAQQRFTSLDGVRVAFVTQTITDAEDEPWD
jgi:hypothetical protein